MRLARDFDGHEALKLAGHDLKTPLTTLKMLAHVFKTSLDRGTLAVEPERTRRNLEILTAQVDKLAALTDELLDVARAYGGRLEVKRCESDLRPALAGLMSENDLPAAPVNGYWSVPRLRQAFLELAAAFEQPVVTFTEFESGVRVLISGRRVRAPHAGLFIARTILEHHGAVCEETELGCSITLARAAT